jgi:hypothetical protein
VWQARDRGAGAHSMQTGRVFRFVLPRFPALPPCVPLVLCLWLLFLAAASQRNGPNAHSRGNGRKTGLELKKEGRKWNKNLMNKED